LEGIPILELSKVQTLSKDREAFRQSQKMGNETLLGETMYDV
jgi:hypothetical protein